MNQKDFNKIVKTRIRQTEQLLTSKGREYAGTDRLSNFKDGASFLKVSPELCLLGYVTKHLTTIVDFAQRQAVGKKVTIEQWEEKLGDVIVYMHLLEALVIERERNETLDL